MSFEVAASHGTVLEPGQILCLQFQTQYQHPSGQHRLRVTTVARPWAEPNAPEVPVPHVTAVCLVSQQTCWKRRTVLAATGLYTAGSSPAF